MTPTRKQKKTWRRRVSRAWNTYNERRSAVPASCSGEAGVVLLFDKNETIIAKIVAPWLRTP